MTWTRGWRISGWRRKTFAKHLWTKVNTDDVLNRAAILSFYFLLALFPLLLFLTALLGYFADPGTELRRNLLTYLSGIVPVSAFDLINTTVDEIAGFQLFISFGAQGHPKQRKYAINFH